MHRAREWTRLLRGKGPNPSPRSFNTLHSTVKAVPAHVCFSSTRRCPLSTSPSAAWSVPAASLRPVTVNPERDVLALPFSSGTTSLPKGVRLTHRNLIANVRQVDLPEFFNYRPGNPRRVQPARPQTPRSSSQETFLQSKSNHRTYIETVKARKAKHGQVVRFVCYHQSVTGVTASGSFIFTLV